MYVIKIWKFQLNFGIGNTADFMFMFLSLFLYSRLPEVQKSKSPDPDSRLKLQPPKNKFSEIKFDQIFWNIGISDATI